MSLSQWISAAALVFIAWKVNRMSDTLTRLQASTVAIVALAASAVAALEAVPQQIRDAIAADEADEDGELGQLADQLDSAAVDLTTHLPRAASEAASIGQKLRNSGNK